MNESFYENLQLNTLIEVDNISKFHISKIYYEITEISLKYFSTKNSFLFIDQTDMLKKIATNYYFLGLSIYGESFKDICDSRLHLLNKNYSENDLITAINNIINSVNNNLFNKKNISIASFMTICAVIQNTNK
jgi:hypothetical protein